MSTSSVFDYEKSDVSQVYAAARALPPYTLAVWRAAISTIVPAGLGKIKVVLDVGCGTGRFSAILAQIFNATVIGLDPSERMLAQAKEIVSESRCSFLSGSLESLPVADRSVDLVFLSMVFHHVKDWEVAHQELRRALRPGGLVLVRTSLRETRTHLWARFFPAAHAITVRTMPSANDVVAQMVAGGLVLVNHRTVAQRFAESARSYLEKIRLRGISSLQMISDEEFASGIAALERHLRSAAVDPSAFIEDMDLFCFVKT